MDFETCMPTNGAKQIFSCSRATLSGANAAGYCANEARVARQHEFLPLLVLHEEQPSVHVRRVPSGGAKILWPADSDDQAYACIRRASAIVEAGHRIDWQAGRYASIWQK